MQPSSEEGGAAELPNLGPLYLVLALCTMASTILATALPSLSGELGGARDYTAVVTVYMLPKALATPVGGRLVDSYRPRLVVALTCLLYLLGTLGCAMCSTMGQLLWCRAVQGFGGGALLASAYTFIELLVPPRQQGQVQARVAIILGLGAAIAPVVGGLLTEHLGWRWCFYLNVPPLLVGLLAILRLPNPQPRGSGKLDGLGVILLAGVTFPLLLSFSWGGSRLPWLSPQILGMLTCSALSLLAFLWAEKRPSEPLFDQQMLRDPVMGWSFVAAFCVGGAFLNTVIYGPLYMSAVKNLSPFQAGLSLLPFIVGNIIGAVVAGNFISSRARYRQLGLWGTGLSALFSFIMMSLLKHEDPPLALMLVLEALLAFSYGLCYEVYSVAVQNVTPIARQGMTGSALEFVRQLGCALGIAVVGSLLLVSLDQRLPGLLESRLVPLGIHLRVTQFEDEEVIEGLKDKVLSNLKKDAQACLKGDRAAYQRLSSSPLLSQQLKTDLLPDGDYPADIVQRLDQAMEKVAGDIQTEIKAALALAVRQAQADVAALCCGLGLMALLASCKLPDRQLRDQVL